MSRNQNEDAPAIRGGAPASRQVSWFEVYRFAERWAAGHDLDLLDHDLLVAGTPQWCAMSDDEAHKLLALVLGGIREALNHEVAQEHLADASREIAGCQNWTAQAKRLIGRSSRAYIPRHKDMA
jgi:hypothetical protein